MKRILFLIPVFIFCSSSAQVSPFTGDTVRCEEEGFKILVSGHFHGSSKNTTGLPALTVRSNVEKINASGADFLVCLGDLFLDVRNDIPAYTTHLFDSLTIPLFNVVGNHDVSGNVYQENYGKTWFSFTCGDKKFIFLDSEEDDGSISGEQFDFLKNTLADNNEIRYTMVFMHRLLWAEEHPLMKDLFKDNTRSGKNNFRKEILPLMEKAAGSSEVYLFGGSLGNSPSCFFFHKEEKVNITYIATAIRDLPKDAMLEIDFGNNGIEFSAFPLPLAPEYYNLDYFKPTADKPASFNWRLVPLYVKTMLAHRYFWFGAGFSVFVFLLAAAFRRWRK